MLVTGNDGKRATLYNFSARFGKSFLSSVVFKLGHYPFVDPMNSRRLIMQAGSTLGCVLACLSCSASLATGQQPDRRGANQSPQVFLLDAKRLQDTRHAINQGDKDIAAAWAKLQRDAQKALGEGPFSIVNKTVTPPSGDKHDYMTQAPYFWPDPKSPNGLPYIRRDGERNPEINKFPDHQSLDKMVSAVEPGDLVNLTF